MFHGYTAAHIANISLHIAASLVALIAGLTALFVRKGGALHRRSGRVFVYAYLPVLLTAALGILVFEFRSFLAVATIAAGYNVFSGYRALRLRGRRPALVDALASLMGLLAPLLFLAVMRFVHRPWSPALTWPILGGFAALCAYDLARFVFPAAYRRRTWVQEHLYKMTAALIALFSTAAATLLPHAMPWAALVPVILGYGVILTFWFRGPRAWTTAQPRSYNHTSAHAIIDEAPSLALEEGV